MHRRIRRVKCGEEKPSCLRCTSTGRKCDFEDTQPVPVLVNSLSLSPNTVSRERRAFAYYFEFAASSVGGGLDLDFWRTVVPQVCRNEPAVWDAIISIGALFECSKEGSNLFIQHQGNHKALDQNHQDVLAWYSRSVSAIRQRIDCGSVDAFVGLISCMLFICIEALQGDAGGALKLFIQGVRLILALRPQIDSGAIPPSKAALLEDTIIPIFVRLAAGVLAIDGIPVNSLLRDTGTTTLMFDSVKSARAAIVSLSIEIGLFETKCMDHLRQDVSDIPQEIISQKLVLETKLRSWHTAFAALTEVLCHKNISPEHIGTAALLSAYHEMLHVILETCTSLSLTNFDAFIPNFQNIVEQSAIALKASRRPDGTQPPFTFEIGVGIPLWFASLRCRHPRTRRAALTLLRQAPPVQGFYQCSIGTAVGERIMELEESYGMNMNATQQNTITTVPPAGLQLTGPSHSPPVEVGFRAKTTGFIPEEARIGPIAIFRPRDGLPLGTTQEDIAEWNRGSSQVYLRFSRNERGLADDSWRMVYKYVPFDYPMPSLSFEVASVESIQ
jgi:hypothetical protein